MCCMQKTVKGRGNKPNKRLGWLPELDRLLITGIKHGTAHKKDAINKILRLVPKWTRGDCWHRIRHLRKTSELAGLETPHLRTKIDRKDRPVRQGSLTTWTAADDDKLLNLAGYEPVKKIAQRLGRSERAVRFRLGALGISAKVTDGWSLRELRKMLRVSPARLRYLIGNGMLRVRDPRVTIASLAAFCERNRRSLESSAVDRVAAVFVKEEEGYTWERTADLLGVTLAQVQSWISDGQLRVVDTFVTDRAFEEFCKKHGGEINMALLDPATAKWLVSEYGVPNLAEKSRSVSRAQKHALVVRTCGCGRKIAGNPYFRHVKICQSAPPSSLRDAI
jgi:hypothetical protein